MFAAYAYGIIDKTHFSPERAGICFLSTAAFQQSYKICSDWNVCETVGVLPLQLRGFLLSRTIRLSLHFKIQKHVLGGGTVVLY